MRKSFLRVFVAASLSVLLIVPPQAFAWGNEGHEAVACVAWQLLTPATKTRVLALLKQVPTLQVHEGKSIAGYTEWVSQLPPGLSQDMQNEYLFMRAATWADSIKHQGLEDSDEPKGVTVATEVNLGFGDKRSHGYWHFIDGGFASDGSTFPATPEPNAATEIVALRTAIASSEGDVLKAYDLIWLEHLVGDIHQPLHGAARYNGGSGDAGGNLVAIKVPTLISKKFKCPTSTSSEELRELHAFWDDLPGSCPAQTALSGAAAYVKGLSAADVTLLADVEPADWAAESLAMAQKDVYAAPIGPGVKDASTAAAYVITTAYYTQASQDAATRIALGGARLAKLLNENLK